MTSLPIHAPDRSSCVSGPRPCPRTACRYHLEPAAPAEGYPIPLPSCSLDVADAVERGDAPAPSQPQVAAWLGISPQLVSRIETEVLPRVGRALAEVAADHGYGERPVTPAAREDSTRRAREALVLAQLSDTPRSMAQIAEATGLCWRSVRLAVERLRAAGHDVRSSAGLGLTLGPPARVKRAPSEDLHDRTRLRVLAALTTEPTSAAALALRLGLVPGEVRVAIHALRAGGHAIAGDRDAGYSLAVYEPETSARYRQGPTRTLPASVAPTPFLEVSPRLRRRLYASLYHKHARRGLKRASFERVGKPYAEESVMARDIEIDACVRYDVTERDALA